MATNPWYRDEEDRRPVVVFGNLASSALARFVIEHDTPYRVEAFTVDAAYRNADSHEGLPLLPFEELERWCPPKDVRLCIPMGYQKINGIRRARYEQAKARGYEFITYVSSRASWWPGVSIGENSLVYEHAILQPYSSVGVNAIVRSGAHVSHHGVVGDHAFVAAMVAMGGKVVVGEQVFLGVGSVVVDSIVLAPRTFVGAGAVVTRPTEADGVYVGNPARKLEKRSDEL